MNDVLYKKDNSREFYFLKLVEYIKCSRTLETVQGQLIRDLILLVLVDKIGAPFSLIILTVKLRMRGWRTAKSVVGGKDEIQHISFPPFIRLTTEPKGNPENATIYSEFTAYQALVFLIR